MAEDKKIIPEKRVSNARLSDDILTDFKDTSCFEVKQIVRKKLEQPQFQTRTKAISLYENKMLEASKQNFD